MFTQVFTLEHSKIPLTTLSLPESLTVTDALQRVLRLPSVASKRYLTNKVLMSVILCIYFFSLGVSRHPECGCNSHRWFFPVSRFEFEQTNLAITSPLANQPVTSESERARHSAGQSEFFVRVSRLLTFN